MAMTIHLFSFSIQSWLPIIKWWIKMERERGTRLTWLEGALIWGHGTVLYWERTGCGEHGNHGSCAVMQGLAWWAVSSQHWVCVCARPLWGTSREYCIQRRVNHQITCENPLSFSTCDSSRVQRANPVSSKRVVLIRAWKPERRGCVRRVLSW